jgi:hypothetical protein
VKKNRYQFEHFVMVAMVAIMAVKEGANSN